MLIQNLKRLSKDTLIYGFGRVIEYIAAFILLPVFTRIFSPADYGILDTLNTVVSVISLFLLMGLNSATQRYYFDSEKDHKQGLVVISTAFWFLAIVSVVVSFILIYSSDTISNILFDSTEYSYLIAVAITAIPFILMVSFIKDVLRLKFAPWKFSTLSIVHFLLNLGIVIFLVIILKKGLVGNYYGVLFSVIITLIISIYLIRNDISFLFSKYFLIKLLKFGLPLVFASFAYWVITFSDRFFILKLSTLTELGLYSVGNRVATILILVVTAIHLAWSPLIFQKHREKESSAFIVKTMTYSLIVFCFFAVVLTSLSFETLTILTPRSYIGAIYVVGLLTLGIVFLGISGIVTTGLTLAKKTKYITIAYIISAVVNIILNALLIPSYGIIGASVSTCFSYILLFALCYYFTQQYYRLSFELKKSIIIIILTAFLLFLGTFASLENMVVSIMLKLSLILLYPFVLYYFNIIDHNEKLIIKNYILKTMHRLKVIILFHQ